MPIIPILHIIADVAIISYDAYKFLADDNDKEN